jgi:hypothetical protein
MVWWLVKHKDNFIFLENLKSKNINKYFLHSACTDVERRMAILIEMLPSTLIGLDWIAVIVTATSATNVIVICYL